MNKRKALVALSRIGVASSLIFIGWGLNDLGHFFAEPGRTALFLLLLLRHVAETLSMNMDALAAQKEPVDHQRWVPIYSGLTMAFLCWFLPYGDRRAMLTFSDVGAWRYLGLALFVAGVAVQLTAQRTLGRQYSAHVALRNNHRLVKAGIYSVIRHPIYLGLFLNICGVALVFRSWLAIPLFLLLTVFVAWRVQQEEGLLGKEFGSDFDTYCRSTKRLLPHVY